MDTKKAVVVIASPALFATIGMLSGYLSGDSGMVIGMTIGGGLVGAGLAGVAWLFST